MPKSPYRLPRGGLTSSGKVLLKMRHGQGVPIKELARDFNVSRRIVKKYLNERKTTPVYTLSPERKKIMKTRKTKIEKIITPLDPAGVPRLNSSRRIAAQLKPLDRYAKGLPNDKK